MDKQSLMKDEYATRDLHFAAFLQVKEMVIKKLEQYGKTEKGWSPVYFIFANRKRCEELEDIFWSGVGDDIMVNVRSYFIAIRDLRSRVSSITNIVKQREASFSEVRE